MRGWHHDCMRLMDRNEALSFLAAGARTGKLATTRADRRPHVTPIWFVLDGEDVVFTTWHTTVKAANLAREGRAALLVDDERPPFSYVLVEGTVRISDDLEAMLPIATRIGGRYMGEDNAVAFGRRNAVDGELLVRLTPDRIVAQANIAD